jgi:hypothetical protein
MSAIPNPASMLENTGPMANYDPKKGKNSYKMPLNPKDKNASYKKEGLFGSTYFTNKRAPFMNPCEQCLFYGYTRTYKVVYCFTKEIVYGILLVLIGFIMVATAGAAGVAVLLPALGITGYYIYLQLQQKMCPQETVKHYCSNCGLEIAYYQDPPNDSCCFGLIPGWFIRKESTWEDDCHADGLIFQYEQAHPTAIEQIAGAAINDTNKPMIMENL